MEPSEKPRENDKGSGEQEQEKKKERSKLNIEKVKCKFCNYRRLKLIHHKIVAQQVIFNFFSFKTFLPTINFVDEDDDGDGAQPASDFGFDFFSII